MFAAGTVQHGPAADEQLDRGLVVVCWTGSRGWRDPGSGLASMVWIALRARSRCQPVTSEAASRIAPFSGLGSTSSTSPTEPS